MSIVESPIDRKVRLFFEANRAWQQFGQANDEWVDNGATACTHTCWQKLIRLWLGRSYSLNRINELAGMPRNAKAADGAPRGMRIAESQTLVRRVGLPYVLRLAPTVAQIREWAKRGPVLYGVRYGSEPDQRGYVYKGIKADGRPNGFARLNGRTQLTGAENIRHAVLFVAERVVKSATGATLRSEVLRFDPNHGSPSRPERPPYDIITIAQVAREYGDYSATRFAFVPIRSLPY